MNTWMIDARTLAAKPTGVGLYAYRLIKKMMSEVERRKFVLVCDMDDSDEIKALQAAGCEVRAYGKRVYNSVGVYGYFRWVKRMVREVRPDVFWQPNNLQPFRVKGVGRVIVTMHDVFGLGWSWRYALWHLYYRWSFWRTLRNVTEMWYNSEQTRREVHGRAEHIDRVERVTYPITEVPERESVAAYGHDKPYFLYLGNVETRKGADILFAAYRAYRDSMSATAGADLLVAGSVRNVPVPSDPHVVHLGYVDDAAKWALMKGCVAMVVPSRAEGFGMQLAEALAFGTRVIASDLPVFEEVVKEQGVLSNNVVRIRGFVAGTDEDRKNLLKSAMEVEAKKRGTVAHGHSACCAGRCNTDGSASTTVDTAVV